MDTEPATASVADRSSRDRAMHNRPPAGAAGAAGGVGEAAISDTYTAFESLSSAPTDHAFYGEATTTISSRAISKEVRTLVKGLPQDGSIAIRGCV
jgi:hypothetical protein